MFLKHIFFVFLLFCSIGYSQRLFTFSVGQSFTDAKGNTYLITETVARHGVGQIYKVQVNHSPTMKILKFISYYYADTVDSKWDEVLWDLVPRQYNFNSKYLMPIHVETVEVPESPQIPQRLNDKKYKERVVEIMDIAEPLTERLQRATALGKGVQIQLAERVLQDMMLAIEDLHQAGYTHNDIKPDNILFFEGRYVLSDYDTLLRYENPDRETWGSPKFLSPEQANRKPTTKYSDFYALGLTLLDLLNFERNQREALIVDAQNDIKITDFLNQLGQESLTPKQREKLANLTNFIMNSVQVDPQKRKASLDRYLSRPSPSSCSKYFVAH